MSRVFSTVGNIIITLVDDTISTLKGVPYCGKIIQYCGMCRGCSSDVGNIIITLMDDTISTLKGVPYCGKKLSSTVECVEVVQYCGGYHHYFDG